MNFQKLEENIIIVVLWFYNKKDHRCTVVKNMPCSQNFLKKKKKQLSMENAFI